MQLSNSATQQLSNSATQRPESNPSLKNRKFPPLHFIVLSRHTHNLERCLQSVFELDYPKGQIKISVVEYGHRPQKAQHLLKKYPDVSFFLLPRKSRSFAQNYLLPQIKEKFLAYIDGDVVLQKNWASHCIEATEGKVNIAAVSGPVHDHKDIDKCLELKTSAILIEKSALEKIGCFKPIFRSCEGVDLACRFFSKGFYIAIISKVKSIGGDWEFPLGQYGKRLWLFIRSHLEKNESLIKALSWDAKVYLLNPSISLCLEKRETAVVDMRRYKVFPLDSYHHLALREILKKRIITPTMVGPLRHLTDRNILIQAKLKTRNS